ncbi:unnamed protein product [Notodromas monacha]|uniref:Serpin domain-containing protein n=1 Tax=Notodromas monacha TaxID=399045 RepID=A0A7R9GH33_9CRUS|nr:unnamed protein product [Notodromas monacha]CAG0921060.1 unnamed protein product [Notodromas monacha]
MKGAATTLFGIIALLGSSLTTAQQSQSSSSSPSKIDNSWLFHSMTQMAIDTHRTIVTGNTIRSCNSSSSSSSSADIKRDTNVVFSPLSISSALSTLFVGSWGQTNEQLRAGLNYPSSDSLPEADIHTTYKANLDALLAPNRGIDINYSNSLFGGAGLSVILYFYQDVQSYYKTAIRGVDFLNKPTQAMNEINRWVKEQTKGKITNILTSPPSPETKLAIANAIHFKGAWQSQFAEEDTKTEEFFVTDKDVVQVPMMTQTMEIPQVRDDELQLQMIALPYKQAEFALYIVLPTNPGLDALQDIESRITEQSIDSLIRRMKTTSMRVSVPRFNLSWKSDLVSVLSRLGVCDAFSPSSADFRRLAVEDGLYMSLLLHQAEMEVNEKGTEAAAATVGTISKSQPRVFKANHPFMFFIRDNRTGLPLFWGRVARPTTTA